jgi:hypothetical protein
MNYFIHYHTGLGDQIFCNGLTRFFAKKIHTTGSVNVFTKSIYEKSVQFMYRDVPNINVVVLNDWEVGSFVTQNIKDGDKFINGHQYPGITPGRWYTYDEWFYEYANVDYKERWNSFFIERDKLREENLFNILNPENKQFILIHEAASDGVVRVDYNMVRNDLLKIYIKNHTDNIFDYLSLIEKAEEIHCVHSSFFSLVEHVNTNGRLFHHNGKYQRAPSHKTKKLWTTL